MKVGSELVIVFPIQKPIFYSAIRQLNFFLAQPNSCTYICNQMVAIWISAEMYSKQ